MAAQRVVNIALPSPHEGVGNALRKSLGAVRAELPGDMMALLQKLDRI